MIALCGFPLCNPEPRRFAADRPAARHHSACSGEYDAISASTFPTSSLCREFFQQAQLFRGPGRQAVSLRRAQSNRHKRARRSAVWLEVVEPAPGRDKDDEDKIVSIDCPAPAFGATLELAGSRCRDRRRADRRDRAKPTAAIRAPRTSTPVDPFFLGRRASIVPIRPTSPPGPISTSIRSARDRPVCRPSR